MKKILVSILIFIYIFNSITFASDIDVKNFLYSAKEYTSDILPNFDTKNIIEQVTKGQAFNKKDLINRLCNILMDEVRKNTKIIFTIIAVSILCGILKNIQASFGGSVSEIAFYVCYLFIVILVISSYTEIITVCRQTIIKLNDFMNILIPLVLSLLVVNGSIASVGMLQPVLLLMTSLVNIVVSKIILPIIFISTMINLVSNISENIKISKIPKLLQKTCVWLLEFMLIIFIGVLSLEGTLAANVDGVTAKATKSIVSTVIPVVGKALSDAADSILGAASITKNAIGVIGVIVIIAIVISPIIKVLIMMITFNVASALIEPIVDARISKCMSGIGDSIKIVFALMTTICMLFIISTTIMIKVGNFSLMYR